MKIGIVLFGHLRSYKQTISSFENLKNILSRSGKVDVFCHTWDIEESVTAAWWKEHKLDDPPSATVDAKKIEQTYSPVLYSVEPSRHFDDKDYSVNSIIPIPGILSMLYSQMQAFKLLEEYEKQNGFKYDVVVKTRYDLLYEIAGEFTNCVSADDGIFLPSSNPYELIGSYGDIFAIGSRKCMEEYFDFCRNFKDALVVYKQKGYKQLIPELCMTVYLEHKNIMRQELYGLRLHILRMNGEKFQINTDKNFQNNGPLCFYLETIMTGRQLLPDKENVLLENNELLVKKYMRWIDRDVTNETLQQYADLYNGKWVGTSPVKRLLSKTKSNSVFSLHVMKNFFEETIRNAKYGMLKKLLLASVLTVFSEHGFFFFRVLKNTSFSKN